jgi:tRNA(Arg) A34 adenosine deaminase TadA
MCLSACYWARLENIHYANGREDAANIGFDDQFIYDEIKKEMEDRKIPMISHDNKIAKEIFKTWFKNTNNIRY